MAKLKINGKDYDIPAVTLGQLRGGVLEKMKESDKLLETSWLDSVMLRGQIIADAMVAKYKDEFTMDDVFNSLDPASTASAFIALLGASGITQPGEATAAKTEAGT